MTFCFGPEIKSQILFTGHTGWQLVAEQYECKSDDEVRIKWVDDVKTCAEKCAGKASMFAFGTTDFKESYSCDGNKCWCACESGANADGSCDKLFNEGYRLYKLTEGIITVEKNLNI